MNELTRPEQLLLAAGCLFLLVPVLAAGAWLVRRLVPEPPLQLRDIPVGIQFRFAAIPGSSLLGVFGALLILSPVRAQLGLPLVFCFAAGAGALASLLAACWWSRHVRRRGLRPEDVRARLLRGSYTNIRDALEQAARDRDSAA